MRTTYINISLVKTLLINVKDMCFVMTKRIWLMGYTLYRRY